MSPVQGSGHYFFLQPRDVISQQAFKLQLNSEIPQARKRELIYSTESDLTRSKSGCQGIHRLYSCHFGSLPNFLSPARSSGGTPETLRSKNHVKSGLMAANAIVPVGKKLVSRDAVDNAQIPVQMPTSPT